MSDKPGGRRKASVRRRRRPTLLVGLAALVVIGAAVLVGFLVIGGDDDDGAAKDPLPQVPSATALDGGELASEDMEIVECPAGAGTLTASGNVVNHGDKAADYAVTVAWLGKDGSVIQSETGTVVDVAPGATTRWMLRGEVDEVSESCVARLTRGSLAS